MNDSTLGTWNIKAYIGNQEFTLPIPQTALEEAYFRMDIGDLFMTRINNVERDYEVDNIIATWRLSHNFDYAIYFREIPSSSPEGVRKIRALSAEAINASNENKFIQTNSAESSHPLDPYGTFSKANLSKGDTFIYNSQRYRITRTAFHFADVNNGKYQMWLDLLKI